MMRINYTRIKKDLTLTLVMLFMGTLVSFGQGSEDAFVTIWKTNNPGTSGNNEITIPADGNFVLYWEEVGDPSNTGGPLLPSSLTISFPHSGIYRVEMTHTTIGTSAHNVIFENQGDKEKLLEIEQWGNMEWNNLSSAFLGCSNLEITATDIPDLSNVVSMYKCFASTGISTVPNMNDWDVSNVTNFAYVFANASSFNEDIGNWDMSNADDIGLMFSGASSFNQDIGGWDLTNMQYMDEIFANASSFNQDVGNWNISGADNLNFVFQGATAFNQDISSWDVSSVKYMESVFDGASSFNQDISGWYVDEVTTMNAAFKDASSFNQDISSWDVSKVTRFQETFSGASSFNQNLGSWKIKSLVNGVYANANGMFDNSGMSCENYSLTIQGWANYPYTPDDITLGAVGMEYAINPDVINERYSLILDKGWTIQGDAQGSCDLNELGIEDLEVSDFNLYPNPTSNFVTLSRLIGGENIEVVDVNGKILHSLKSVNSESIDMDLGEFDSGIYFVQISNNGQIITKKLSKQ